VAIPILEPGLGTPDPATGVSRAIAFRFAIPTTYDPGNPVTLRFFFYRTGVVHPTNCFRFQVDGRRLVHGTDIEDYGDRVWVRPIFDPVTAAAGGLFLVIDLPINTPDGLNATDDLEAGHFLAFELNTVSHDNGLYELLGVEAFESETTTTAEAVVGAAFELGCP
jgi:hypothetical protein